MMLHVVYRHDGEPISDFEAEAFAYHMIKTADRPGVPITEFDIANEIVIDAVRVLIKRGKISHQNVLFFYKTSESEPIRVDRNGTLSHYPDGFLDMRNKFLSELIS